MSVSVVENMCCTTDTFVIKFLYKKVKHIIVPGGIHILLLDEVL